MSVAFRWSRIFIRLSTVDSIFKSMSAFCFPLLFKSGYCLAFFNVPNPPSLYIPRYWYMDNSTEAMKFFLNSKINGWVDSWKTRYLLFPAHLLWNGHSGHLVDLNTLLFSPRIL